MEKTLSNVAANPLEQLSNQLVHFVSDQIEQLVRTHLPKWRIPGVFAGHKVGPDVRADLAFTLGFLHEYGVQHLAGRALPEAIAAVLRLIDGSKTNTFWSYRVAETLALFGTFDANKLMADWSVSERVNLASACDSTKTMAQFNAGRLPRNYAAVLARCELARARLGLVPEDDALGALLLRRVVELFKENTDGYLDDSKTGTGRYDIYTADLYLFSEPFSDRLGQVWRQGTKAAIRLVERTVASNGAAFPWGRSGGALAACMTIELGCLGLREHLVDDSNRWLSLIRTAFHNIPGWFSEEGLITAHHKRTTYRDRDTHRRLQMTFDCLGKLAWSAIALRAAVPLVSIENSSIEFAFPEQDQLVWFDEQRKAGVWCYRSRHLAFVLPIVGSTLNDYLPTPHNPGLFEIPVELDLPTGTPFAFYGGVRFVAGHLPLQVTKLPSGLRLHYASYPMSAQWEIQPETPRLPGSRTVTYRVDGRTLLGEEDIRFDKRPEAVGFQIAETHGRPLAVQFDCPSAHSTTVIDTAGLREYRSPWAQLSRVHQLDLDSAEKLNFSYRVTPLLRVLSADHTHRYHRTIYDALAGRVVDGMPVAGGINSRAPMQSLLRDWDLFHLHWPESGALFGPRVEKHQEFIRALAQASIRIIWTQHNLSPHNKDERFDAVFDAWAASAHGVIHHSHWGMEQACSRYRFRKDVIHRVIPHPHFGLLPEATAAAERARTEAEFGLVPGRLRLGIVGAPRQEKQVDMVIRAFAACGRDDLELLVFSLGPLDPIPDYPRIFAQRYNYVPHRIYNRRLRAIDVLILPFATEGMLTTGTVADAIARGIPALISDWPFLCETLGDAGISYGSTLDDLVACLHALDAKTIDRGAAAASALRAVHDPARVAELTFELLEAVGTSKL